MFHYTCDICESVGKPTKLYENIPEGWRTYVFKTYTTYAKDINLHVCPNCQSKRGLDLVSSVRNGEERAMLKETLSELLHDWLEGGNNA